LNNEREDERNVRVDTLRAPGYYRRVPVDMVRGKKREGGKRTGSCLLFFIMGSMSIMKSGAP